MSFGLLKKFILYLPNIYFKENCFGKCNSKLIEKLLLRGIHVLSYDNIMNNYIYDDSNYPEVNILYIWLTDNKYYSDRIYSQKKTELEREILFLLTGILGGSKISCNSYIKTDESFILNQKINTGLIDESIQLKKINSESNSIEKDEIYSNTGSPILLESEDWEDLKENIKIYFNKIDNNTIISFNYLKNNSDLLLFTFKRFKLRLNTYHYKIDEEKSSEKSIQVRSILKEFGLSADLETKYSYSKTHLYNIEFYSLSDLKHNINKINYENEISENRKNDIFVDLRCKYILNNEQMIQKDPNWSGDEMPIYNQCIIHAKELNIYDKLKIYINENPRSLNGSCHWFKSRMEVDKWFNDNLDVDIN